MARNEENLWEKFRSTGSVEAYLEFCAKRKENTNKNVSRNKRNCN